MESVTKTLAKFVVGTSFEDLPEDVIHQTKRLILDTIGCAIGGHTTDKGKIAVALAKSIGGSSEAHIIGTRGKVASPIAAYANGELANALDFDECLFNLTHFANSVVSGALAAAEYVKAQGRELISSVALGFDVAARIGLSFPGWARVEGKPPKAKIKCGTLYFNSYHVYGVAAAVGKLLKLNNEEMVNALAIAGYNAPVPNCGGSTPSGQGMMTKYYVAGWMALTGMVAVLLSKAGFTGDYSVLDVALGKMMGLEKMDQNFISEKLAEKWFIMETSFKPYPCCRYEHVALDIFCKILQEQKLSPQEIERVTIRVPEFSLAPGWLAQEVKDGISFQFCIPYIFAVAALGVKPGPEWQSLATLKNPKVIEFAKRIKVEAEPKAIEVMYNEMGEEAKHLKKVPSSVEVVARGRTFSGYAEYAKGDPWTPETKINDEELEEKFRTNSYGILSPVKVERAIQTIFELEKLDKIARLTELV